MIDAAVIPAAENLMPVRSGGEILVAALAAQGADRIFGVPGESSLPIFDALRRSREIRFVTCRHEANAAHMAEADAKMTRLPGLCLVSRGPGAMHAAIGLHTAMQDSTPFLLMIGQVPRSHRGREAFQEIDYASAFAGMAKWVAEINEPEAIPEAISRAFHTAMQGRPGPIVLSFPEDVLSACAVTAVSARFKVAASAPQSDMPSMLRGLIEKAERPLVIAGGDDWSETAREELVRFLRNNDLPLVAGFRSQAILDNRDPHYCGDLSLGCNPQVGEYVRGADLLIVIGDRLGDITTQGYRLLEAPQPQQRLVHVYPGAEELGRVYRPDLPVLATPSAFMAAVVDLKAEAAPIWAHWRLRGRETYEKFRTPPPSTTDMDLARVIAHLRAALPDDAIVTNGAGNYSIWLHRFFEYRQFGTQLAPRSGAMGYGLPAAIAAKLRHPQRTVVALAGDGCFLMASPDFATALREKLGIVVIVMNNSLYGSIRMHQERHYPGSRHDLDLTNPDFSSFARAYGAHGEVVRRDADFPAALQRALASGGPAIIELKTDPNQVTPTWRIEDLSASPASIE